jgi:hypothetical protein
MSMKNSLILFGYRLRIREHIIIINFLEDIIHKRKQSMEISLTESTVSLRVKSVDLKHIMIYFFGQHL